MMPFHPSDHRSGHNLSGQGKQKVPIRFEVHQKSGSKEPEATPLAHESRQPSYCLNAPPPGILRRSWRWFDPTNDQGWLWKVLQSAPSSGAWNGQIHRHSWNDFFSKDTTVPKNHWADPGVDSPEHNLYHGLRHQSNAPWQRQRNS